MNLTKAGLWSPDCECVSVSGLDEKTGAKLNELVHKG